NLSARIYFIYTERVLKMVLKIQEKQKGITRKRVIPLLLLLPFCRIKPLLYNPKKVTTFVPVFIRT
ncbi:hypothetical protein, partial [Dysgonomonas capnocytophagoides]|uniref:hypothetical protein n=1 Tax=Dysgonomonas capnocytophagoides TaxID=45254 RepID=UPI002A830C62